MRFLPFLFIALAHASAQTDAGKLLEQGLKQAVAGLAPVPDGDRSAILDATAALLARHVTLRRDGTASAYETMSSSRRTVEWRNFVVNRILTQPVTEADRLSGITKR